MSIGDSRSPGSIMGGSVGSLNCSFNVPRDRGETSTLNMLTMDFPGGGSIFISRSDVSNGPYLNRRVNWECYDKMLYSMESLTLQKPPSVLFLSTYSTWRVSSRGDPRLFLTSTDLLGGTTPSRRVGRQASHTLL